MAPRRLNLARPAGGAPRPRRYVPPSYPRAMGLGMALLAATACGGAVDGNNDTQPTGTGATTSQTGGGGSKSTGGGPSTGGAPNYFGGGSGGGGAPEPYTGGYGGIAGAAGQAGQAGQAGEAGQAGATAFDDAGSADADLPD